MMEITVKSSIDGTLQPNLFYAAKGKNRPLIVGLHTWSHDRYNQEKAMLPIAIEKDWNLLLPEFRGANLRKNPNCRDACGSQKAKQDIIDAVEYVKNNYEIDIQSLLAGGDTLID